MRNMLAVLRTCWISSLKSGTESEVADPLCSRGLNGALDPWSPENYKNYFIRIATLQ